MSDMTPEEKAAKREAAILAMVAKGHTRERAEELINLIARTLFGPGGRFATPTTNPAAAATRAELTAEQEEVLMHPKDCRCVRCLVDRSSLGTPEAKAARESVSDEQVARVMARFRELEAEPATPTTAADESGAGLMRRCPHCGELGVGPTGTLCSICKRFETEASADESGAGA